MTSLGTVRRSAWLRVGLPAALSVLAAGALLALVFSSADAELSTSPDDTWQVVGHLPDITGLDVLVWDFAELDGRMYVAGSFAEVRRGPGSATISQPYLAAFDVDTGVWIPEFRPRLDGTVFSVEASPNGERLLVGGAFTGGITSLHPLDGRRDRAWTTSVTASASTPVVMDIEVAGSVAYVGGRFTGVDTGAGSTPRGRLAKLDATTGGLYKRWTPTAEKGMVWGLAASKSRPWVHVVGRFSRVNGDRGAGRLATVDTRTGALVPHVEQGDPADVVSSAGYLPQKLFTVVATEDHVWVGGEPHVTVALDAETLATERFWYTNRGLGDVAGGGDTQALYATDDRLYSGCHCWGGVEGFDPVAEPSPYPDWVIEFREQPRAAVRGTYAVDLETMEHVRSMTPDLTGADGVWAIIEDTNGSVWFGGQFSSAAGAYPGGFVRYTDIGIAADARLVELGATWRYHHQPDAPRARWIQPDFNDSAWPQGNAEIGFGDGDEVTVLDPTAWNRSAYFRTSFDVDDPDAAEALALRVRADDGYVAYLNGDEVARANLPSGPLSHDTAAPEAVWGSAERNLTTTAIDPALLRAGRNTLAVAVHNTWASEDLSFAAELIGAGTGIVVADPGPAPERPGPLVVDNTANRVMLRWTRNMADAALYSYEVRRDGVIIGTTTGTTYADDTLDVGRTATYELVAVSGTGMRSAPSNAVVATRGAPSQRRVLVANQRWRYWDRSPAPPVGWQLVPFPDQDWPVGRGTFGRSYRDVLTTLQVGDTAWFRTTFSATDIARWERLHLYLVRDDSAIVYLNGHEVARDNLDQGPADGVTPRNSLFGTAAGTQVLVVSPDLLVEGTNHLAVRVDNSRGSQDMRFDLAMVAWADPTDPADPPTPPTAPGPPTAQLRPTTVELAWPAATDDAWVVGYVVLRDEVPVGFTQQPSFSDPLPDAGTHRYRIVAIDDRGARSAASAPASVDVVIELTGR